MVNMLPHSLLLTSTVYRKYIQIISSCMHGPFNSHWLINIAVIHQDRSNNLSNYLVITLCANNHNLHSSKAYIDSTNVIINYNILNYQIHVFYICQALLIKLSSSQRSIIMFCLLTLPPFHIKTCTMCLFQHFKELNCRIYSNICLEKPCCYFM